MTYEGTWAQACLDQPNGFAIERIGEDYAFTGPGGEQGPYGLMVCTTPDESGLFTLFSMILDNTRARVDGDALELMTDGTTIRITVSGEKMT